MNVISFEGVWRYPSEHFALPEERRLPIYTLEETLFSASLIPYCEKEKRHSIAKRIEKRLEQLEYYIRPIGELAYYFKPSNELDAHIIEASNFGTIEPIVGAQPTTMKQDFVEDDEDEPTLLKEWLSKRSVSVDSDRVHLNINISNKRDTSKDTFEHAIAHTSFTEESVPEIQLCNYVSKYEFDSKAIIHHAMDVEVNGSASFDSAILAAIHSLEERLTDVSFVKANIEIIKEMHNMAKESIPVIEMMTFVSGNTPTNRCKYLIENRIPTKDELHRLLTENTYSEYNITTESTTSDVVEFLQSIRINKKRDVSIDLRDKLTFEHYNDVHKVAIGYRDSYNIEGLKDISAYAFSIISTMEADYINNHSASTTSGEYNDRIQLRTLWIDDFKMIIKIIQKVEPGFDFMKYYKLTGYDKKIFIVNTDTIKFLVRIFKMIMGF